MSTVVFVWAMIYMYIPIIEGKQNVDIRVASPAVFPFTLDKIVYYPYTRTVDLQWLEH